jgi:RimJ/RimL family protein N-acetyltransferase
MSVVASLPSPARLPLLTSRLVLRPYEAADEAVFFALLDANRARLEEAFPARLAAVQTQPDAGHLLASFAQDWLTKRMFVLGIWKSIGGEYVGDISLKPTWKREMTAEIGYYLALEAQGQGYAREALAAAVQLGFSSLIQADRLLIRCRVDNPRSCAVAVAAGFRQVTTRPRLWPLRTTEGKAEILYFSLSRAEADLRPALSWPVAE